MRRIAVMSFCAGAILFWEPATPAQEVTSRDKLPAVVSAFDDGQNHEPLPCSVHAVKPELNFGFRFQTGYTFETSLDPYLDGQHHWYTVFRVTPENNVGLPVYFLDSLDLPIRRFSGLIGEYSGAFQTGKGRYRVEWGLLDDLGRVCRQEWKIDAHLTFAERPEKVAMPPGTVGDLSSRSLESLKAVTKSRHATILLNAAMPILRRDGQSGNSWGMLLSMLASIVEQMPETSFRVVAFDTEQQRELFRKDDFTAEDMNDVARVANAKQHWAVDYHSLQDPAGGWHLLRDLENKEINAPLPVDTVIFLGVSNGRFDNMPRGMPGPKTTPRFFYLKYGRRPAIPRSGVLGPEGNRSGITGRAGTPRDAMGPYSGAPPAPDPADKPDLVDQSVRHLNGKIFVILSPANFSKALAAIRR
jgi:hypothetical protein